MNKIIPISIIGKKGHQVVFFDSSKIPNPDKIASAYIEADNIFFNKDSELSININNYLSKEDENLLYDRLKINKDYKNVDRITIDVTKAVRTIASGNVENKGIVFNNMKQIYEPNLVICYYPEIIYPSCDVIFFDKKICLFDYAKVAATPWFFSGISDTITFFAENMGNDDITIHLENSPDAREVVKDAQRVCIKPGQTIDIVPYKFSKFIRFVAVSNSNYRRIDCKVWFQTQLKN